MRKREFHFVARAREGWGKGDYSFFFCFGSVARFPKSFEGEAQAGGQKGRRSAMRKSQAFLAKTKYFN